MPESKLREIADAADMIVSGFAFNKKGESSRDQCNSKIHCETL